MSRQHIILSAIIALTLAAAGPAYASTPDAVIERASSTLAGDIAAASGGYLEASGGGVYIKATEVPDAHRLESAVTSVMRVCDGPEAIAEVPGCVYEGNGISASGLSLLESHKAYVDGWIAANIQAIVPAGTGRDDAISLAFDYIVNSYRFDYEAEAGQDIAAVNSAQGAYYAIVNGRGLCSSLSKLFRGIVEAVPFNADGKTDYAADPSAVSHISVAIVDDTGDRHEWASIQDADGTWYHYDVSDAIQMRDRGEAETADLNGTTVDLRAFHVTSFDLVARTGFGRDGEMRFEY